jgi:acyl-coenzyme A thioesterase PaaI-like protein
VITNQLETKHRHNNCAICGEKNLLSMEINFISAENNSIYANLTPHSGLQGYDGYLHGGVISTLLDAAMTHCLFHYGVVAVTGDLHIRFLHLVPYDVCLTVRAQIKNTKHKLYLVSAELLFNNLVFAKAEAKFMKYLE